MRSNGRQRAEGLGHGRVLACFLLILGLSGPAAASAAATADGSAVPGRGESAALLATEQQRLQQFSAQLDALAAGLASRREAAAEPAEAVLRWRRLVAEAAAEGPGSERLDALYAPLRADLRRYRQAFSGALDGLADPAVAVPPLWPNPMATLEASADGAAVAATRANLAERIAGLQREEQQWLAQQARALEAATTELNRIRLAMLPQLSPPLRDAITGFGEAGFDQVRAELWQLSLVWRYHLHLLGGRLGGEGAPGFFAVWEALAAATPVLLCLVLFLLSRRHALPLLQAREGELAHAELGRGQLHPSAARLGFGFLAGIWRPLEWCLLYLAVDALLPVAAHAWLEVRLALVVVGWMLAGYLIIHVIDSLARVAGTLRPLAGAGGEEGLRLRSLRLIGRAVILLAVLLAATAELVGKGSIYRWVATVGAWLMLVPLLLLLRDWRVAVAARARRRAGRWPLLSWVADNSEGRLRLPATLAGGAFLAGLALWTLAARLAERLDLAGLAAAVLRRQDEAAAAVASGQHALPAGLADTLSPDLPSARWLDGPQRGLLTTLAERARAGHGGLVALVGACGSGRSTLLQALAGEFPQAQRLTGQALAAMPAGDWPAPTAGELQLLLVDDAHALFRPCPGGLATFDALHAHAHRHAGCLLWVFVFDDVSYPFLTRSRDHLRLFDAVLRMRPWNATEIEELLLARTAAADARPRFDSLLPAEYRASDPDFRQEELEARKAAYFRLLWSHAEGNPGLALEAWRRALAGTADGGVQVAAVVAPLRLPPETMRDNDLFVLRTILMTEPASVETVCRALDLPESEVLAVVQGALQQGHLEEVAGLLRVSWRWRRAVLELLNRKHLLVQP